MTSCRVVEQRACAYAKKGGEWLFVNCLVRGRLVGARFGGCFMGSNGQVRTCRAICRMVDPRDECCFVRHLKSIAEALQKPSAYEGKSDPAQKAISKTTFQGDFLGFSIQPLASILIIERINKLN